MRMRAGTQEARTLRTGLSHIPTFALALAGALPAPACRIACCPVQGVHQMFEGIPDRKWLPGEERTCKMVFIGKFLEK